MQATTTGTATAMVVLIGQLRLLLLRAQLGVPVQVDSVLRAAWLVAELEGD